MQRRYVLQSPNDNSYKADLLHVLWDRKCTSMELICRKLLRCVSEVMGEVSLPLIKREKWVNDAHG